MSVSKRSFQLVAWFSASWFSVRSLACNTPADLDRLGESAGRGRHFPEPALSKMAE